MAENKKERHKCPPEPWPKPNVLYTPGWNGEDFNTARSMWEAHRRRVQRLVPMPRSLKR